MIKDAAQGFFHMVCFDAREVRRVCKQARSMGLDIPCPLTYEEFVSGKYYAPGIKGFLIDNADMLLQRISENVKIISVSMTKEA